MKTVFHGQSLHTPRQRISSVTLPFQREGFLCPAVRRGTAGAA